MSRLSLKNMRLGFPKLFEPQAIGEGKPRYGAALIDDKHINHEQITAAIDEVIKEKWPKGAPKNLEYAYRNGDTNLSNKTGDVYEGFAGNWYLSANRAERQGRPIVLGSDGRPIGPEDNCIYAGCRVHAVVSFFADTGHGAPKICCVVEAVKFAGDDEPFSGGLTYDKAADMLAGFGDVEESGAMDADSLAD